MNIPQVVYLDIPYKDKDKAKKLGAKWDTDNKKWFIMGTSTLHLFRQWLHPIYLKPAKASTNEHLTPTKAFLKQQKKEAIQAKRKSKQASISI